MGHGVRGKAHVGRIDGAIAEQVAVMMQALATPSRVLILARLRESPHAVGELAAAVGMELSAVSHQLRLLRQLGLVVGERHGRQIVYALHDSHVADPPMSRLTPLVSMSMRIAKGGTGTRTALSTARSSVRGRAFARCRGASAS